MCAHCPTDSLPFRAPPGTDKECVLRIFHKGSAVATRLIISFLETLQVRIKATMSRKHLCQVKADLTLLSIQPGGDLRDWSPCHLVCHFSTSLRLPSLRMASFARAISCGFVKQVSSLHTEALVQPALVPEVWLAQRGNNLFPCDGLVEVPNFKGHLRDQRFHFGLLPDRLIECLLKGRDVTPFLRTRRIYSLLVLRMRRTSAPAFCGFTFAFITFSFRIYKYNTFLNVFNELKLV